MRRASAVHHATAVALMIALSCVRSLSAQSISASARCNRAPSTSSRAAPLASDSIPCFADILSTLYGYAVSPDSVYEEAVRQRERIEPLLAEAGRALFGGGLTAKETLRRARTDEKLVMRDADSVLAAYSSRLEQARTSAKSLFKEFPDAPITVRAIPREQAANSAPAAYSRATNASAALLLVNAYQPGGIARMNVAFGTAHEAYPGHHFQRMYSDAHGVDGRYNPDAAAFTEGWGIYAEQLGDESGLYDHALDRIGYLTHLLDVFIALQIEVGMHARGWSETQARDTMMIVAGRAEVQALAYARRHSATPGQLASYGIGYLAITSARERARAQLGDRFDVREFHDVVLRDGSVPLPTMIKHVNAWIAQSRLPSSEP